MDTELNKPLSKNDLILFEKLKIKWKELSVEVLIWVCLNLFLKLKKYFFHLQGYYFGWSLFKLHTARERVF